MEVAGRRDRGWQEELGEGGSSWRTRTVTDAEPTGPRVGGERARGRTATGGSRQAWTGAGSSVDRRELGRRRTDVGSGVDRCRLGWRRTVVDHRRLRRGAPAMADSEGGGWATDLVLGCGEENEREESGRGGGGSASLARAGARLHRRVQPACMPSARPRGYARFHRFCRAWPRDPSCICWAWLSFPSG
uniref:Uncharacterized protein n=1 Tax=Oryza brachyantha TaxID=4533 RepID=J3MEF9_ORYBR